MAQIIALLLRLVGLAGSILGIVSFIQNRLKFMAQENVPFTIETSGAITEANVTDSTFGLQAIHTQGATILTAIASSRSDVLTAIANLTNGSTPVSLPVSPPPGYQAPSSSANASEVWNFQISSGPFLNIAAFNVLGWSGAYAKNVATAGTFTNYQSPYFYGFFDTTVNNAGDVTHRPPLPDITAVRRTDTVLSWLQREAPAFAWQQTTLFAGRVYAITAANVYWVCTLTNATMQLEAFGTTAVSTGTAPVWPGLSNVTLGASLALADGLTVPGPLDGVIVTVTAVPPPTGFYPFGAVKCFVKIGGVIFVDDNGEAEMALPLGLEHDVICPRTMERADHAIIRLKSGTIGTVQPWVHV